MAHNRQIRIASPSLHLYRLQHQGRGFETRPVHPLAAFRQIYRLFLADATRPNRETEIGNIKVFLGVSNGGGFGGHSPGLHDVEVDEEKERSVLHSQNRDHFVMVL